MATPTGQTGSVEADRAYTSDAEILERVRAIRANRGLSPDAESDRIWLQRVKSGTHTLGDARTRIEQRAASESGQPRQGTPPGDLSNQEPTGGEPRPTTPPSALPITEEPPSPQINYRAYAPSWMKGALLDTFVDHWSTTGDAGLAMEAVRRAPQYDNIFFGNRREDGSLRYNEQQWFATRDAFTETAAEFGVGQLDRQAMEQLFRQDVSATEFMQGVGNAYQTFAEPGADVPQSIMSEFLKGFTSSGSAVDALEQARESRAYDDVFRGNKREDGSLRMQEQEYYAYKRGWQRTLTSYGLDPQFFDARGRFVEAVEGEISVAELGERLDMQATQIEGNIEQVREFYAQGYGLDLSRESILAAAIDPTVERDLFQRKISAAQIGGEAKVRGFARSVERAEEMARAGVTQQQARSLYGQAEQVLPGLSATTQRFFRGTTDIGQFEEASALGDVVEQNRFDRALGEEQSSFSRRDDVRRDQSGFGLAGLRRRG